MSLKSYVCFIKSRWNLFFLSFCSIILFFYFAAYFVCNASEKLKWISLTRGKKETAKTLIHENWHCKPTLYHHIFFSWNQLWLCERLGQSKWHFYGKMAWVLIVSKYKLVHLTKTLLPKIEKKNDFRTFFHDLCLRTLYAAVMFHLNIWWWCTLHHKT